MRDTSTGDVGPVPKPRGAAPYFKKDGTPSKKRGRKPGVPDPHTRAIKRRLAAEAEATAERVVLELTRCGLSDISHLFGRRMTLKSLHTLPVEARVCIKSVKVTRYNANPGDGEQEEVVEVVLWDKMKALELLARYHGLLKDKVEVSGSLAVLREGVQKARARLQADPRL